MNLNCLDTIINDNLAIHIDISNINSWNLNTGLTLSSLTKWNGSKSDDIILYDFGLTGFDNGRTANLYDSLNITKTNNKLSLYRVGYNLPTGNTNYDLYDIQPVTGSSVGRYYSLNGGYLQGYHKLYDYNYEVFPPRFVNGITIETLLEILPQTSGIFFYMGVRSEDKYNNYFSGECGIVSTTPIIYGSSSSGSQTIFSGVTTSENNNLNSYLNLNVQKNNFIYPESSYININSQINQIENLKNNVIAFEITNDKRIGYKLIDDNGIIEENYSTKTIDRIGWTIIDIVFQPYENINNYDKNNYKCYSKRKGNLIFYLNGSKFWLIKDFNEFYFREISTNKELQQGIPFNISWGGGSFGLKHSWHYDVNERIVYSGNNMTYINNNFVVENSPIINSCDVFTGTTTYDIFLLSADTTTFIDNNSCNPNNPTQKTVLSLTYTGTTGNSYYLKFNNVVDVLSNREYVISLKLFESNFFNVNAVNNISIYPTSNTVDIEIVDEIDYHGNNTNAWNEIFVRFKTTDDSGLKNINIGVLIESSENILTNGILFIDDYRIIGSDKISQDSRKSNLLIEKYFNNSFIGNIQKLRIYDVALTPDKILHNSIIEGRNNNNYNLLISSGGRLISKYQNIPSTPQQTSGSDIRKSIRYRNVDGSYKDLYQMLDIKVIIKSRTNPNVELIKFKKTTAMGWEELIYVNDTTYDFIVPDTITSTHANEILFAEIKFQWEDLNDIDNTFDKIFVVDITKSNLLNNSVKDY